MMLPLAPASPAPPAPGPAATRGAGRGQRETEFEALLSQAGDLASGIAALLGGAVATGPTTTPPPPGSGVAPTSTGPEGAGEGSWPCTVGVHGPPANGPQTNPATGVGPAGALMGVSVAEAPATGSAPDSTLAGAVASAGVITEAAPATPARPAPGTPPARDGGLRPSGLPTVTVGDPLGRPGVDASNHPATRTTPANGATPATPATPANGATPATPATPANGATPAIPASPASPASPGSPASPASPGSPAVPAAPGAMAGPAEAGAPANGDPVGLGIAATPTRPGAHPPTPVPIAQTGDGSADASGVASSSMHAGLPAANGPGTPQAPSAEAVAAPAVPARIAELARRRSGTTEQIVVRLDPPELGTVRITLTARGDQVHVTVRAETPEARAALDAQRDQVENLLRGEGFDLSSFDVGHQRREQGHARPGPAAAQAPFGADIPEAPAPAADGALRL